MNTKTLLTGSLSILAGAASVQAQTDKPMNVIFILCDDMGYGDLGCYGQKYTHTPNLDRMAEEGMQFMQHYAGCPVSAPSRCSIQTGLHTGHTQVRGNREVRPEGQMPMAAGTYTIARLMKSAGYATGIFGKWGLGLPGSESTPNKMGYDEFYGYNCQRQAHTYYPDHLWHNETKVELPGNNKERKSYSQDMIHAQAMEFIRSNKKAPFFAMLTYTIPHAELALPNDKFLKMYEGKFEEKPYINEKGYQEGKGGYNTCMQPKATFSAMISRLDSYVGEIMAELKKQGIAENTMVFFSSDNGPHTEGGADPKFFQSNGPLRGVKRDVYEGGIRVPFLAWSPSNIPAGVKTQHMAAFWDLMPTLADISKTSVAGYTDGISYLPTLLGKPCEQNEHKFLYWEFHEQKGRQAVRVGNWKLIRQPINGETRVELYDISQDIHEDRNLATMYPAKVAELVTIMDNARTETPLFDFGRTPKK